MVTLLALGFLLGLQHATDPDHVVAVSTMLGNERRLLRCSWIGVFWGAGHTLSLIAAGMLVVVLKTPISATTGIWLETAVAAMLVFLGARVLFLPHRHEHLHDGSAPHSHWHTHSFDEAHSGWPHFGIRPFVVGMVHGAAGSAALTLLILSTVASRWTALSYTLVFGAGSIVGMLCISMLIALPLSWAGRRAASTLRPIQNLAGAFSCVFGVYLGLKLWVF